MNKLSILAITFISLALIGCQTSTQYQNMQVALSGSPALKKKTIAECSVKFHFRNEAEKANAAALMNVSPARAQSTACNRFINAMASGRLQYSDYLAARRGGDISNLIRVMQGR
jgi:hypothetical protein